jgi:hypothetical protein
VRVVDEASMASPGFVSTSGSGAPYRFPTGERCHAQASGHGTWLADKTKKR